VGAEVELEAFRGLLTPEGAAVLGEVQAVGVDDDAAALAVGSRLRRTHPPGLVAAAITQARLRARAEVKFGAAAASMWFTPTGLEQSTRAEVAALRARRFAGSARVVDLCCGVGADLVALAAAGSPADGREVTGVEADALTAAVAAANVAALVPDGRARVVVADATTFDVSRADAVFCDPARRTARGRVFDVGAYSPPWPFVRALLAGEAGLTSEVAVKVAPGIPHGLVPAGVEAEWVSVRGEVKEAALYAGALVSAGADGPARRRATLLPGGHTLSAAGADTDEEPPPVGAPGRWLYEPDGAVVRSHLVGAVVGALGGRLLDPTIAYVTGDVLVPSPFATAYEVTDVLPFSVKRLRALLRARGVGRLTVKKRGSPVTPEELRRQLGLRGDAEATVVLTRCAGVPTMLLVRAVAEPPEPEPRGPTRRGLLRGGAAAGASAFVAPGVLPRAEPPPPPPVDPPTEPVPAGPPNLPPSPFTLGVAAGEPQPTGVVLWTRLARAPLSEDGLGGMPATDLDVEWQLAEDEGFRRVVRTDTEVARPESAHSVHVEVDGLEPGREYFYRFRSGGHLSPVGRTRTAPAATSRTPVHFAVASCSNWQHGYFTAYRHLAESGPDLVFHLGDYIYESEAAAVVRGQDRYHLGPRAMDLPAYRQRHSQYKTDADLQAAHAAAPWVVSYDDHEVLDNWAGWHTADPADQSRFLFIRAAAMQAYYENMPLRRGSQPIAGTMRMFRRLDWGRLATFHVLDTRQYRDAQSCTPYFTPECPERMDPSRSMLGLEQEAWLRRGLTESTAVWDVLAQGVFFCPNDHIHSPPKDTGKEPGWNMDAWDGYVAARDRLVATLLDTGVRNPVVLSGDVHSAWANEILREFGAATYDPVGVEFVATSISSGGNGGPTADWATRSLAAQPHLRFFDGRRGWTALRATADELRADYRTVPYVRRPGAPVTTAASFVVENGKPRLRQV
jgi:alkaline phosphatase D